MIEDGKRLHRIIVAVENELVRVSLKFGKFNSTHEGAAVIKEEYDELWDAVKQNDLLAAEKEALQVAAMAVRFIYDLGP